MSAHDVQVNEMAAATRRAASAGGLVAPNEEVEESLEESEHRVQNQFVIDQIDEEEDEDGSSNGEASPHLRNQRNDEMVNSPRLNQFTETPGNLIIESITLRKPTLKKQKSVKQEEEKVVKEDDDGPPVSQNSSMDSVDRMWN